MSEELTHAVSHLINIASQLPLGQPKVVNLSMPRGSGKTTAILNLLTDDDILIVSSHRHWRYIENDYKRQVRSKFDNVTVLSATLKKATHEAKVDWGKAYNSLDYKNVFEFAKPYVELNCLNNLPREAIMGRRWNPRVIFVDEPELILRGQNFLLLVEASRRLIRDNYEAIIVGVGT